MVLEFLAKPMEMIVLPASIGASSRRYLGTAAVCMLLAATLLAHSEGAKIPPGKSGCACPCCHPRVAARHLDFNTSVVDDTRHDRKRVPTQAEKDLGLSGCLSIQQCSRV